MIIVVRKTILLREVIIRKKKKKVVNFHNWGGGHPKMLTFSQLFFIFFACSNSSISAIKNFFEGGRGTPRPIYFENFDNFQLNIDVFLSILGFQGRNLLFLHIMFFMLWRKSFFEVSQL